MTMNFHDTSNNTQVHVPAEGERLLVARYVSLALRGVTLLGTVVGSALTLAAVARTPSLQTVSNYFIASLAAADLVSGLTTILAFGVNTIITDIPIVTDVMFIVVIAPLAVSMLHLWLIAMDRYIAVQYHMLYERKMTITMSKVLICVAWLLPIASLCLAFAYGGDEANSTTQTSRQFSAHFTLSQIVLYAICVLVISPLYLRLLLVVRRHQLQIGASDVTKLQDVAPGDSTVGHKSHNFRSMLIMFLLMFAYVILWAPYWLMLTLTFFGVVGVDEKQTETIYDILFSIGYINVAVNTVIYAAVSKEYRAAYVRLFRCGP